MRHRSRLRTVLLTAALACLLATPAAAEAPTVRVGPQDEPTEEPTPRYSPAEVTVTPGTTVRFVWESPGHSVRHQPRDGETRAFDSHPGCRADRIFGSLPRDCGTTGDQFEVTVEQPGTYVFQCGFHGEAMQGVLRVVEPQPAPSPKPAPAPQPSPTPSPTPAAGNGDGGDGGGDAGQDRSTSASSRIGRTPRSSSPLVLGEAQRDEPAPTAEVTPGVPEPDAADGVDEADEPELEPFPEAPEPSVGEDTSADEVALPLGHREPDRTLPLAVAVTTLLASVGLVVRFGIFGT